MIILSDKNMIKKTSTILVCLLMFSILSYAHISKFEKIANEIKKLSVQKSNPLTSYLPIGDGKTIYVSVNKGSNRNDGTKSSPLKDLQKAVDEATEGSVIMVAEGNYLGKLDAGYVKVDKYLSIIGGYSDDFSQRDPLKYRTTMRPGSQQATGGTMGSCGLLEINVAGKRNGVVLIDGIIFDRGLYNTYAKPDPSDPRTGTPVGGETGQMVVPGAGPQFPIIQQGGAIAFQLLHGNIEGQVTICNCVFANGLHYAIQMGLKGGNFDIYNNVFVANRMAACEVFGMTNNPNDSKISFHNNTVLFSWCRTKQMEDMGYGFRFMTGFVEANVYDNVFGCNNYPAIDRTRIDSDSKKEAMRKTAAWNNIFFENKSDLCLPSGGGKWLMVKAKDFDDVDQLSKSEKNRDMNEAEIKIMSQKIDNAYLKGFLSLTSSTTESFDGNSSSNQMRSALGMNMQGTETTRVSMYANRYPYEKIFDLFGAINGYGAQKIK